MPFANGKKYFKGSVQFCHKSKNITPMKTLNLSNLGIFQSLKLRILMGKIPSNFSETKFHSKYFGRLWDNQNDDFL